MSKTAPRKKSRSNVPARSLAKKTAARPKRSRSAAEIESAAARKSAAPADESRCTWAADSLMWDYHDREWGVPVHDDRRHFEFLVLEGAQAGLSWSTVLKKREGYRRAFDDFDPEKVARFTKARVEKILLDPSIIRNRLKVESAVKNAKAFLKLQDERGSFDAYIWEFVGGAPIVNRWKAMKQIPPRTKESDALSKDLKKRGFTFVGSTIIYAHMQACGLVNDHTVGCWRWKELQRRK